MLIAWRKWGLFVAYIILALIPFVNIISIIWFFIYGWLSWKQWILDNENLETEDQKIGAIKTMELFWIITAIMIFVIILLFIVAGSIIMWALMNSFGWM